MIDSENQVIALQDQTLLNLKSRFTDIYKDRLEGLYLFGSRARGTAEADSDIDVLVVLKGDVDSNAERRKTLDMITEISLENDVVVSCLFVDSITYAHKQGPLFRNIRREGIPL